MSRDDVRLNLDLGDTIAALDGIPRDIARAERSAKSTTATWAKKQLSAGLLAATGATRRYVALDDDEAEGRTRKGRNVAFTMYRVLTRRKYGEATSVFMGLNPVGAGYLANLTPFMDEGGEVQVGNYFFEDVFIKRNRRKVMSVFQRVNKAAVEQKVNIATVGYPIGQAVGTASQSEMERRFTEKLKQLNPYIY